MLAIVVFITGDGRQEIQLTAMVPIDLPVLGNLSCRLLVEVLVRAAGVKELSVPVMMICPFYWVLVMMMMFITIIARD